MTKIRPALSPEDALDRIIGLLGREEAAAVIEKTSATLYAYADPDKEKRISLADAMKLDAACQKAGNEAPFFAMQRLALEAAKISDKIDVAQALLAMHASAGQLTDALCQALDPASPGGRDITIAEAKRILDLADKVLHLVHRVRHTVHDKHARKIVPLSPFVSKQRSSEA